MSPSRHEGLAPRVTARRIGQEGEPLVIIDDFAPHPDALRETAAAASFRPAGEHYPGVRAPLPDGYLRDVRATLAAIFAEVFGAGASARVIDASFSIVTAKPDTLTLAQRLPHVDAVEPGRVAMVHYLGQEPLGGTAFYRHRATGFETLSEARASAYFAALNREAAEHPPTGYPDPQMPMFTAVERVPARFNRAILYRSRLLHSGDIPPQAPLSDDPRSGRLTVTGFFDLS